MSIAESVHVMEQTGNIQVTDNAVGIRTEDCLRENETKESILPRCTKKGEKIISRQLIR